MSVLAVKNRYFAAPASLNALNAIAAIREGDLDPAKVQKLARWMRKIGEAKDDYDAGARALFNKHWKEVDGNRVEPFEPADPHAFGEAQEAYGEAATEIRIPRVKLDWFEGKAKLTAAHIAALDWWIELPDDDTP